MSATGQLSAGLATRYVIERQIGKGGMATVYLALDIKHERRVALKVLLPELGAVLGKDRFLSEIRLTANLQHPHILPLFDSGDVDGLLYYTMPFVEGESLRSRLDRERQLPVDEAVRLASAVASALDHAHRRGVIHRDLKPENILLADGQPVVADFGIALAVSKAGGARITESGLSLGTPQFMSPEQATGDRQLDARTDVYSLGAVTYEMLTGEPPHIGATSQTIIARVVTESPRSIRASRRSVPAHVESAVLRALEKVPADRFATAAEFAAGLSGAAVAAPSTVASRGADTQPGLRQRLRDPLLLTVTALFLAASSAAVWALVRGQEGTISPVVRFVLGTGAERPFSRPAISPDGQRIAYRVERAGPLFVHALDRSAPQVVPGTDGAAAPTFSPDGGALAFVAAGEVRKVALNGGGVQVLADSAVADIPAWTAPDLIVFATARGLARVSPSGMRRQQITALDSAAGERAHERPYTLSDGSAVLFRVRIDGRPAELAYARVPRHGERLQPHKRLGIVAGRPVGLVDDWLLYHTTDNTAVLAVRFNARAGEAEGQPVQVLAEGGGYVAADLSRNGTLSYMRWSVEEHLVLMNHDGSTEPLPGLGRGEVTWISPMYPALSPTGRTLAFSATLQGVRDIWTYDFRTRAVKRLTTNRNAWEPHWMPDGRRIIFSSDSGGTRRLWSLSVDAGGPAQLLAPADSVFTSTLSPDGHVLVYATESGDIWTIDLSAGRKPQPLFTGAPREMMPRFSPDGRWMAYVADYAEAGSLEVYATRFPGDGRRVQISTGGGTEPLWSRDGRRIYYRGGGKIMEATLRLTGEPLVTDRRALFPDEFDGAMNHLNYTVTLDGKQLLMVRLERGKSDLVVVLHWLQELRARLAAAGT